MFIRDFFTDPTTLEVILACSFLILIGIVAIAPTLKKMG